MRADRGSIRFHRGGWELRVQHQGKRVTRRVKAPDTRAGRRVAEDALEVLAAQLGVGADRITVAELLAQYEEAFAPGWSPSTLATHHHHVRPMVDDLGSIELARLRPVDMETTYGRWAATGTTQSTIRRRHSILAAALAHAERWEMIAVSPARKVQLAARVRPPARDLPELGAALAAIGMLTHPRLKVAAELAAATGARRGELLGLRWLDFDEMTGSLAFGGAVVVDQAGGLVRKSTKGGAPKRMLLDDGTVDVLSAWRRSARERAMAAGVGRLADEHPILASPDDPRVPWHPDRITRQWIRHRDGIGLGHLRFHDLRHLHATSLLADGVPVHSTARRLGNTPEMILGVYGHAVPAQDQDAADVIGRARRASAT